MRSYFDLIISIIFNAKSAYLICEYLEFLHSLILFLAFL